MYRTRVVVPVPERLFLYIRIAPQWRLGSTSEPRPGPRSTHNAQKWPLGHRRGTMPRCATATVPTASHTSQVPTSTTEDANSASAALHASPCAALRPRSSLSTYIYTLYITVHSPSVLAGCWAARSAAISLSRSPDGKQSLQALVMVTGKCGGFPRT